eukprot:6178590-Pleurochrysis_carterae.AAC.2
MLHVRVRVRACAILRVRTWALARAQPSLLEEREPDLEPVALLAEEWRLGDAAGVERAERDA